MQLNVRSRIMPYILATTLAVGSAVTGLKAQDDQFIRQGEKIEQPKDTERDAGNRNLRWINFWEIVGLAGIVGIFKLADYIDKKDQQKEETESDTDTINKTEQ